jgi:alanine dehydrogenase
MLGMPDIAALVDMRDTIEVQREAFLSLAAGHVTASPNSWLRLPDQERRRGWLKILAGHDSSTGALGVKVLARFADNPPGANLGSLIMLFDEENGFPLAIMDGVLITALRTGASAGLATEVLAAPDARRIALLGTGVVGWHSLQASAIARPSLGEVRVFSRSESRRTETADRARAELSLAAVAVDSVEAAVEGADIIITATNAPDPVLLDEHVAAGALINAMGIRTEIAPDLIARAWVIPDGVSESIDDGKFSYALAAGAVSRDDLGPQLGEVLIKRPHYSPERISLFDSSGVAVQDLALALHVHERARAAGIGVTVDFGLATALV